MNQEHNDEFASALVDLANALDEWKDAGGDSLAVVSAIQKFIFVQMMSGPKEGMHKLKISP